MPLVSNVLGHMQQHLAKITGALILIVLLLASGCSKSQIVEPATVSQTAQPSLLKPRPTIKQVDTPTLISELAPWLDNYEPQVEIRQPRAEQIFNDATVSVTLDVRDLPIYKDKTWHMGPHVELFLDNQPYDSIYDISQSINLENLTPGTHTLRAFAARPWHESFKNEGAYAQVTFHIFAKTDENAPAKNQPLLTYGSPMGTYGAEPVLLDFHLTDTPLHQVAQANPAIADWQVQYTINGESLTLKNWEYIYIEGLKPGQNWVQLALVDDEGQPIEGVFNNTVRLIEYDPSLDDGLAKIVRGELTLEEVGSIVDPTYEPPVPEPIERPSTEETSEDLESSDTPRVDTEVTEISEPDLAESQVAEPEASEPALAEDSEVSEPESEVAESEAETRIQNSSKTKNSDQIFNTTAEDKAAATEILENEGIEDSLVETKLEKIEQASEQVSNGLESAPDQTEFPDNRTDNEAELSSERKGADEIAPDADEIAPDVEVMPEIPNETETPPSNLEEVSPPKRRYLQRLYDYRERSMKTYGQDR